MGILKILPFHCKKDFLEKLGDSLVSKIKSIDNYDLMRERKPSSIDGLFFPDSAMDYMKRMRRRYSEPMLGITDRVIVLGPLVLVASANLLESELGIVSTAGIDKDEVNVFDEILYRSQRALGHEPKEKNFRFSGYMEKEGSFYWLIPASQT